MTISLPEGEFKGKICSGNGFCQCGQCQCEPDQPYIGQFCEKCPSCPSGCERVEECIRSSGECHFPISSVKKCLFKDADGCKLIYKYEDNIWVQKMMDCPMSLILIGVIIASGIVAIGIGIILIWKILITIQDIREFKRFEQERLMADLSKNQNPLFKRAVSTFPNPTYSATSCTSSSKSKE